MKWIALISALCLMTACSLREREKEIETKLGEINQKEQELLLKEKSLQLREDELTKKEKLLDSTRNKQYSDTLTSVNPQLVGSWSVKMNCIETTCSGSAVGDTKTEQWEITYQDQTVIAKAMAGQALVRVYTGNYSGNTLQLTAQSEEPNPQQAARMTVRLTFSREDEMEGNREITRADDCKIVYALQLKKK